MAVTDLALGRAKGAAGISASAAAALVVLDTSPGLSVTELGRCVGLSQPAAARMVDTLESGGLVERRPGRGRTVMVRPTRKGRQTTRRVLEARGDPLTELIRGLDDADQATLARLLGALLTRLYGEVGNAELMCRLCDRDACTNDAVCPVGEAEQQQTD